VVFLATVIRCVLGVAGGSWEPPDERVELRVFHLV